MTLDPKSFATIAASEGGAQDFWRTNWPTHKNWEKFVVIIKLEKMRSCSQILWLNSI